MRTRGGLTRSIDSSETPQGDVRRVVPVVKRRLTDRVADLLEGLPANGDVIVLAAAIANRVPQMIEAINLANAFFIIRVRRCPGDPAPFQVFLVTAVEAQ